MITPRPSARAILDTPAAYSYRRDPAVPKFSDDRPIIIFDGYCALCSGWAQFVLRHDRRAVYRLLRAQSPLGRSLYVHYDLDPEDYQTNILLADGIAWFESEGSIRMAEGLGWPWSLAGCPAHLAAAGARPALRLRRAQPAELLRPASHLLRSQRGR